MVFLGRQVSRAFEGASETSAWGAGVLFTKVNVDTFGEVLEGAFADLEDLLGRPPVARGGNGEARRSDALLMQLAAMCIFVAWNINYTPPGHTPG